MTIFSLLKNKIHIYITSDTRRIYKGENLLTRNYKSMSDFSNSYTRLIDICNTLMEDNFSICEDKGSFHISSMSSSVLKVVVDGEDITSSFSNIRGFGVPLGTNVILESWDDSYATITFDRTTEGILRLTSGSIDILSAGYTLKFKFPIDSSTNKVAADSKVEVYLSHSYPVWLSLS